MLGLPADYFRQYVQNVEAVTLDAANAALARRLSAKDLVVAIVGTASQILEKVASSVANAIQVDVVAFDKD
jgi:predicted Zn-dependent peptidase